MGFRSIKMPAYNKTEPYPWGQVLWPENFPMSRLEQLRLQKGPTLFAMTYLCDPAATGGLVFDREKFMPFAPNEEEFQYRLHSWDVAGGESREASWTVCLELSISNRGFFVTHVWRERAPFPEVKRALYRLREDRKPNIILIEEKFAGLALLQEIEDDGGMPEVRRVNPQGKGDKEVRAQRHAGLLETGRLFVPSRRSSVPWLDEFLNELAGFPVGAFNDQVDALSQALDYARGNIIMRSSAPVNWMRATPRSPARTVLEW
jgi:predicted phage terminase large subunit-like protein